MIKKEWSRIIRS